MDVPKNYRQQSPRIMELTLSRVLFRACLLWNLPPLFVKQSQSLLEFKSKMKTLRNIVCTCMICKLCIMNEYHCSYDIYNVPRLVLISLDYMVKIL